MQYSKQFSRIPVQESGLQNQSPDNRLITILWIFQIERRTVRTARRSERNNFRVFIAEHLFIAIKQKHKVPVNRFLCPKIRLDCIVMAITRIDDLQLSHMITILSHIDLLKA